MIMRTLSEMITWIEAEIRTVIPDFPVDVQPSPDDTYVLCVRVYAVPRAEVEHVEETVFELEERLLTQTRYILLPMVKNLEVTRQYYPEHLPPLGKSGISVTAASLILDACAKVMAKRAVDVSWTGFPTPQVPAGAIHRHSMVEAANKEMPNDRQWEPRCTDGSSRISRQGQAEYLKAA